jgi:uncharacterized protein (TIGR03435 family)
MWYAVFPRQVPLTSDFAPCSPLFRKRRLSAVFGGPAGEYDGVVGTVFTLLIVLLARPANGKKRLRVILAASLAHKSNGLKRLPLTMIGLVALAVAVLIGVLNAPAIRAQSAPAVALKFEVASVRPTSSTDDRALLQATPGRLVMRNLAPRRLILMAYDIQDYQLARDPGWIDSDHYDIQAKADGNPSVQQMEGPMLRALLEERFKLTLHRETRQLPVYKLSVGKSGLKLEPSKAGSCTPYVTSVPPPTTTQGEPLPNFCGFRRTAADGLNRILDGKGVTMATLATTLSRTYISTLVGMLSTGPD